MSESDFVNMTRNGALCNAAGEIGAQEFEKIMRGEVMTYLQVLVQACWFKVADQPLFAWLFPHHPELYCESLSLFTIAI